MGRALKEAGNRGGRIKKEAQKVDCGVKQSWAAVHQSDARRTLRYLDESEGLKVSTKELKEQVLFPNETRVNIERIVRQARSEKHKKLFQIFSRQGAQEILVASKARWE